MATIATIPLKSIERIQLYINNERMTLSAIKAQTGADYAINGTLYDMARWMPVMHYRVDGQTMVSDPYNYHGYGWDSGADIHVVQSDNKGYVRNYICGVELVRDGKPCPALFYDAAVGGVRGRTAIAITKAGELMLYCVGDGQVGRCTPEELRSEFLALGVQSAVMLDGGASSQCIFPNGSVTSSRIVENVILVFTKKEAEKPVPNTKYTVCLDPGHGGKDCSNGSPDGSYKEHEFTLSLSKRIKALLEKQGIRVIMTRDSDTFVDLRPRCAISNGAKADMFLSVHSNAVAGGWNTPSGLCAYTYAVGGERDRIATAILVRMMEGGIKLFGQKLYHQGFSVLKYTDCPAVLIEYGFHTNREDVALLKDSSYRDKLALLTAKGICDYFNVPWLEEGKKYAVEITSMIRNKTAAQAVVDKLKEIGIVAVIKEV